MRITVNGQRAEIQIKRSVDISKWNSQKECAIGKERKSMELNHYLDTVRMKVLQIHRELEQDGKPITADVLKRRYYGEGDSPKMLLEVFQEHNRKYRELMGKDYVAGTVLRYERTARYLGELLQKEYRMNDIPLKEINHEFIARFEHYVKTEKSCAQNATVKYLKNFKKIIKVALVNKWITDDPFLEIHFKQTKTNRAFLTEEELNILLKKEFTIPRLQTVRDIFVFCALTGLAFTDVQHLRYEHIIKDINGEYWIRKAREKTDNMRDIPLLDIPRMILEKYKTHPECLKKGVVLPVPSNQRMNSYLKEIADICGINKPLSTHIAEAKISDLFHRISIIEKQDFAKVDLKDECADILIMVNCAYADGCTTKEEYLSRLVSFYNKAGKPKLVILEVIDASYTCEDLDFPVCIRLNPQDVESMFPMSKISSYLTYKYPKNKRTKRLYVIEKR